MRTLTPADPELVRRTPRERLAALPHGLVAGLVGAVVGLLALPVAYAATLRALPDRVVPVAAALAPSRPSTGARADERQVVTRTVVVHSPAASAGSRTAAEGHAAAPVLRTDSRPQAVLVHKPLASTRTKRATTPLPPADPPSTSGPSARHATHGDDAREPADTGEDDEPRESEDDDSDD